MPYQCKLDKVYAAVRRGDEEVQPGKEPYAIYDGMIYDWYDPSDKKWGARLTFSDHFHGECAILEFDRSWIPYLQEAVKPVFSPIVDAHGNKIVLKRCSGFLDWKSLGPSLNSKISDYSTKLHVKHGYLPVADCSLKNKNIIKDASRVSFKAKIPEVGQITAGSYTIGPGVGDDYPTFAAFVAAFGTPFTGDVTGTQNGNVVENAVATITEDMAGFNLRLTSNASHEGDPTAGWSLSISHSGNTFELQQEDTSGGSTCEVDSLRIISNAPGPTNARIFEVTNVSNAHIISIHDNMVDGNNKFHVGMLITDPSPSMHIYNNVMWDCTGSGGIYFTVSTDNNLIENNTIYSMNNAGMRFDNQNAIARNNAVFDNGSDFSLIAGATGRYNACSDATGANANWDAASAGNIINQVAANCFEGTNDANANFLDITETGPLDSAGEANGIVARTDCIRDRDVPNDGGNTSIGAAEIPEPEPPPPPPPTPGRKGGQVPHRHQMWHRMSAVHAGI